jgi:serine/threonine-protein kinase
VKDRGLVGVAPTEEEARAFLQTRVTALFKLMFWSLVALLGFLWGLYTTDPRDAPEQRNLVYLIAGAGLAVMAFLWRVLLVRRPLSVKALYRIDLAYSVGIGGAFGAAAYLQSDLRASGYLSVVYSTFTVFARALIVPSSGRRTALTSAATMLPMTIAASALAVLTEQDVPGPVYFVGYLLFCVVPIALATTGSKIIYGLRRQVTAAQQLGQYKLDRKIGEGGMGAVYLAHHVMLRRPTAVKLVLPERVGRENLERFEREAHHMSKLTHPNTVAVYDYGRSADGVFYYAMEYLGGGIDLERLVREHGPQPGGRVAMILAQVCGALHEAHANTIIHRDIKPANLILCERGGMPDVTKVVDYGLVNEIATDLGPTTRRVLGTPAYLAPEAITDPRSIAPSVDLYALGAVGYFLLTGRHVFEGSTQEICAQQVSATPRRPSEVLPGCATPELEAVIMRCLEKLPADRFRTALELRAHLKALRLGDWSDADGRRWWNQFRDDSQTTAASSMRALTVSVDLGERDRVR